MKVELTEEQVQQLLVLLNVAAFPGKEAEKVVDLKNALGNAKDEQDNSEL